MVHMVHKLHMTTLSAHKIGYITTNLFPRSRGEKEQNANRKAILSFLLNGHHTIQVTNSMTLLENLHIEGLRFSNPQLIYILLISIAQTSELVLLLLSFNLVWCTKEHELTVLRVARLLAPIR